MLLSSKVIENSGIQFGTSGARGLVEHFSPDVCAAFTHAFVELMKKHFSFEKVAIAIDNRPSSYAMAQACCAALIQQGLQPIYYGVIPTPALAYTAMQENIPCIMVTGSHIPFDRNGLKFYRPDGEISKIDEQKILLEDITFEPISNVPSLEVNIEAAEAYCERYTALFPKTFLAGKRVGIYEHSSAGRDIYQAIFEALGANVISLERTDQFVPIDTEAVADEDRVKAKHWSKEFGLDFIFSTDGDGDRPLVADEGGEWLRGDILGLLCSQALLIEAIATPISSNTIISNDSSFKRVQLTKIGSPYVIEALTTLREKYSSVAGFEANGGYLLASDIKRNGGYLKALPTRDAVLPALMLLYAARNSSIQCLVNNLPQRFTFSDRIQNIPTSKSKSLIEMGIRNPMELLRSMGLNDVSVIEHDFTDGLRMLLSNHSILHLRPSGNAPELRCYVEASSLIQAKDLTKKAISALILHND